MQKTLDNTSAAQAKEKISDLQIWGDGDTFKLICKASSKKEGWMKSTKAMQIDGVGCIVQVTTQQANLMGYNSLKRDDNGNLATTDVNLPIFDNSKEVTNYSIAEAVTFVPGVKIEETLDDQKKVVSRKLIAI